MTTGKNNDSKQLEFLRKRNELILSATKDGLCVVDLEGNILDANPAYCKMIGYGLEELKSMNLYDIEVSGNPRKIETHIKNILYENYNQFDTRHQHKNGNIINVEVSTSLAELDGDKFLIVFLRDIEERKRVEDVILTLAKQSSASTKEDEFFRECVHNLARFYGTQFAFIGLLTEEAGTRVKTYAVWAGDRIVDNFEYELEGTPCQDVLDLKKELIPRDAAKLYPSDQMLVDMGIDSYYGAPLRAPTGKMIGLVSVMDVKPLEPRSWAVPILDIYATRIAIEMARKQTEEKLHGMASIMSYRATHDALTNLINRREFDVRLGSALKTAHRDDDHHALCYMDLDQFKVVNDTCGHIAGDELLKQISSQLQLAIRESDTLARLGGDEFGVLLWECPLDNAKKIAESLLDVVKSFRFIWEGKLFEIGVSIGLVPITKDVVSISDVLRAADSACYVAKDLGRNRLHIYQHDDTELAKRHGEMQVVTEITQALEQDRFVLYRQSIVPLNSAAKKCNHYELLVRMVDSNNKLLQPEGFIKAAERYNLMPSIDRWVIKKAFSDLTEMYKSGEVKKEDDLVCSINLSGTTLSDDGFIGFMHEMVETYQLPAKAVCFEITETAAITNIAKAMKFISEFKEQGFLFALDDFGAGLSSYSYLKNLPVDYIKIDGKFVSEIHNDPLNQSIVESINQVGHTMGIKTIAEWVDSEDVQNMLKKIGVDYAQGFAIDKPTSTEH